MRSKFKTPVWKPKVIQPIDKVRDWNGRVLDRAIDVKNRILLNGTQPSQMEWEEYRKLREAYKSMGEWMSKLEGRYTPFIDRYGLPHFKTDGNTDYIKF